MVASRVTELAQRIIAIDWTGRDDRTTSRGQLMKEYLRRAAWWARATGTLAGYPFFDIAAAVDPAVRADQATVGQVSAHLAKRLQGVVVSRVCINALHFAALSDAGVPLPDAPEGPFEPLLVLFERGGSFQVEGGGFIGVDTLGIRAGSVADNLRDEPYVHLDRASLDALDDMSGG